MPFDVFDPGPSNWNGPFSVCQADNQQLMPKANLGPVYNQMHLSEMTELCFKSLASDRFVPFPHPDGRIIQQSAQTPCVTQQLRRTGDFPCNSAQGNGSSLVDADDQPDEVAYLCDPLVWSQLVDLLILGMIELVDRHWVTPFRKMVRENRFYWRFRADQLFCC
jgi:hypothetical protein